MQKEATVPADWSGKRVFLRFGAVAGKLVVFVNGHRVGEIASSEALPAGKVTVAVEFTPDNATPPQPTASFAPASLVSGTITLLINGKKVGSGHIPGVGNNSDTFDIGYDRGSPVSASYTSPFPFTGTVESVRAVLK